MVEINNILEKATVLRYDNPVDLGLLRLRGKEEFVKVVGGVAEIRKIVEEKGGGAVDKHVFPK